MEPDVALAAQLARNLDAAFPALVAAHTDRLYTIALRLLGDRRDAEEVAQDALVRAYRAMAEYPAARVSELRLRPWLAQITVNLARNRRRNLADRMPPETLDGMVEVGFDPADGAVPQPAAAAEARAEADELAALLLRLPSTLRAAVILRHVDGLSVAETAEALGRPEGTIKAQVSRGLERLRGLLLSADGADGVGVGETPLPAARTRATTSIHGPPPVASITPVLPRRASAAPEVLR
ncbi:MAG TPA: RNA polymerase sigma factor [Candidatus Limnocylindrales bacterium]|jgi:RNA polymerase sigma-70 factor (ECF subfamily)